MRCPLLLLVLLCCRGTAGNEAAESDGSKGGTAGNEAAESDGSKGGTAGNEAAESDGSKGGTAGNEAAESDGSKGGTAGGEAAESGGLKERGATGQEGTTALSTTSAPSANATSKGSQPPTDATGAPTPTHTLTPTKADTSPSTGVLPTASASTKALPGASALPPTTSGTPGGASAPSSTDAGTLPGTGTPPPTGVPSRTPASTLLPANTLLPADTNTPPTKVSAPSEGTAAVVSATAEPLTVRAPSALTVLVVHVPTSAAVPSSVATPAVPMAVAPSPTTTAYIPSSGDATDPAAVSPSQKPQTPETITVRGSGATADKEHTPQNGHQSVKPVASTESIYKHGKVAVPTTRRSGVVSQPPASGSGTVISITASTSLSRHTPTPGRESKPTDSLPKSQFICENQKSSSDSAIILTLNQPVRCGIPVDPSLHNMLCKAVKATFNRSRDICTVRLNTAGNAPNRIAVLGVSVQTNAAPKELFDLLETKKGEFQQLGISNVTYASKRLTEETEDRFSMPLIITIVCMACSLLLIAAIYGCCHQRVARRKDQQRLTEELQTMENGYHDNPTLEVMETSSEMQEKKVNLNGELGDSWIVPMDNLTKEELEGEEDTHL
ncbi:podocalyxin isoform X2 [Chelonia mydas]|uniref:podocalyxin isoform X3 n=1 Tax=Chelonia mydas TaxID=8469 RepID=UPI0018A1F286|nr:podocalyxin isoform X3 [Chelonia mydas]XP_037745297.1 podocalyxin isoform X4 [Chelonia mydas]XP_043376739.1 podocalyxin isoform X2 [Chelonia mydas]